MYHPKIIEERYKKLYDTGKVTTGPQYLTTGEVSEWKAHLDNLVDPDTARLSRDLTAEESEWIRNQRSLCLCDFLYYATRYCYIRHWQGGLVLFSPTIAQNIALDQISDLELRGRAIMLQILKARQLGMSTITELLIAHRVQFLQHITGVIASSDPDKSAKMAKMVERVWENMPWWLMPRKTKHKAGELIEFGGLNSVLSIQHGTQYSGIARGDTVNAFHLSELTDYRNPAELVDASLVRAAHESPWLLGVLESTAKGRRNWWHRTWLHSKEFYWKGGSRFCPMFLPWFVGTDLYPTETWRHSRPIPTDWVPMEKTHEHAMKAREYVRNNSLLAKHLGSTWAMPKHQMYFWEMEKEAYRRKDQLAQFYSEMPADDHEAFQSSARSVFSAELLMECRSVAKMPLGVYGLVGPQSEIPAEHQPARREIDPNMPPLNIRCHWNQSSSPYSYQLVPLKMDRYPTVSLEGKIIIWEFPEDDEEYGIGIDTAEGIGQERSALEVIRKGTYWRNDGQAAEFASKYHAAMDMWPIALAMGTLYSTRLKGVLRQARQVIECAGNGETTQHELRKRGWHNFHPWARYDRKIVKIRDARAIGWYTNSWSRPMLLDYFIKGVRDGQIDLHSPELLDEMADFEKGEKTQKLEHALGSCDDRILALGMVFFSLHIMELWGGQMSLAQQRKSREEQSMVPAVYTPGYQGMDLREVWSTRNNLLQDPTGFDMAYGTYTDSMQSRDSSIVDNLDW